MRQYLVLLILFVSTKSFATTWTVDDDGKADFTDIQSAINASSDGDEILIMPGTYTGTGNEVVDTLGKAITLKGQTAYSIIIDGENVRRGVTCRLPIKSNVIIENLWIKNCISDNGGGLWIEGSPEIKTCVMVGNNATSAGGNVYVLSGNPNFSAGCNFNAGAAPYGAGVYCRDGSPEFDSCFFLSNNATERGGGIRGYQISGYFSNCSFNNNTAARGGAGHFQSNLNELSSTFDNCYFQNNTASSLGGGVVNNSTTDSLFQSCSFINNTATGFNGGQGSGGGLYNDSSNPQILSCIFESNTANSNGGGIYNWSSTPQVQDCQFLNNSAATGGGIKSYNGTGPSISVSTFCENIPDNVSGVHVDEGNNCLANLCNDYDNNGIPDQCESTIWTVDDDGLDYPSADFNNIQSAINTASNGEMVLVFPGTYTGSGTNVVDFNGKEIWLFASGGPTETYIDGENERRPITCQSNENEATVIEGFTISNGQASEGGGVQCSNSSPSFVNCIIENNSVNTNGDGTFSFGGGIFCYESSPSFTDCIIQNNQINDGFYRAGAGMYCIYSNPILTSCLITNNSFLGFGVNDFGGGIRSSFSDIHISECEISGHYSSTGSGISILACELLLTNTMIEDNIAYFNGGGLHCESASSLTISDCSFSGNLGLGNGSPYPNGHNVFARDTSAITFSNANDLGTIDAIDFCTLSFNANSNVVSEVNIYGTSTLQFDINEPNPISFLEQSGIFTNTASLAISNSTGSLDLASEGDIYSLITAQDFTGIFSSTIFPLMPEGLGLRIMEYPDYAGKSQELVAEVIPVNGAEFENPFTGNQNDNIVKIISFDANGDNADELAVLFEGDFDGDGMPDGYIAAFSISDDGAPIIIEGFGSLTGNGAIDLDAGDLNSDGLDDLIVVNSGNNTITLLVTEISNSGDLEFIDSIINTSYEPTCASIIDWNQNYGLDLVVGLDIPNPLVEDRYQVILDVTTTGNNGPSFAIEQFELPDGSMISDTPTCADGGNQQSGWGFAGSTEYGRVYQANNQDNSMRLLGEFERKAIQINAVELNSTNESGLVDLMVASNESQSIYIFEGDKNETNGFREFITLPIFEPIESILSLDADRDNDIDIVMASPNGINPLILLRNDGLANGLTGSMNGVQWSKQAINSNNSPKSLTSGTLGGKDEDDDWVVGAGNNAGLIGTEISTLSQMNIATYSNCPCDLNNDRAVSVNDLLLLIADWGACSNCDADFDNNNAVDVLDLLVLIAAWGPCN